MLHLKDPETPLGHAEELSDSVVAHYTPEKELASIEVLNASSFLARDELLHYSVERLEDLSDAAELLQAELDHEPTMSFEESDG